MVSYDDLIITNKKVRDYRGPLEISLNDKNPSLGVLTIGWALESKDCGLSSSSQPRKWHSFIVCIYCSSSSARINPLVFFLGGIF